MRQPFSIQSNTSIRTTFANPSYYYTKGPLLYNTEGGRFKWAETFTSRSRSEERRAIIRCFSVGRAT